MILTRIKKNAKGVLGVLKDDNGGTYCVLENPATLIPEGEYVVAMCDSPRFGKKLPLLTGKGVGAERGVRMHEGNRASDSKGCLLLGNTMDLASMTIGDSREAMAQMCRNCGKKLVIGSLCGKN